MPSLEANPLATKWSHRKLYTLMLLIYHQHDVSCPEPRVIGETTSEVAFREKMKLRFNRQNPNGANGLSWLMLGMKMRGFGQGRWNGYGGKVEPGDVSPKEAALREMQEESGLAIDSSEIEEFGRFWFTFDGDSKCMEVHLYINWNWKPGFADDGSLQWPCNTEEMHANWFPVATHRMLDKVGTDFTDKLFGRVASSFMEVDIGLLPFASMWPDDHIWLPRVLRGHHTIGWLHCCPLGLEASEQEHLTSDEKENQGLPIAQFNVPGYRFEFFNLPRFPEVSPGKSSSLEGFITQMQLNSEGRLREWMSSRDPTPACGVVTSAEAIEAVVFG